MKLSSKLPFHHRVLCLCILCPALLGSCTERPSSSGGPAHHGPDGRFRNIYQQGRPGGDLAKWLLGLGPKEEPAVDPALVPEYAPESVQPRLDLLRDPPPDRLVVTWVGHSTFLIQTGGLNILTDPHWGDRASPVSWAGPKRQAPPGVAFEDLPRIDFVLLSHNHYDHLDLGTVRRIGNGPRWLVPLGLKEWFRQEGIDNVEEADWWERRSVGPLSCTAVPAQHFSRRGFRDGFKTLWLGWVLDTPQGRVYFAGDTGYSPHASEIGERLGPMRLALLPIGAYMPQWFMGPMHMNPPEAVQTARDVQAAEAVAMHWGTFKLTDESLAEPPVYLRQVLVRENLPESFFRVPRFGESFVLE